MMQAGQVLPVVSAAALTSQVPLSAWGAGQDARAVFHPPAKTAINRPRFLNAALGDVQLLGPFFLWPDIGRAPANFPAETLCPELTITRLSDVICLPGQIALRMVAGAPVLLEESLTNQWDHHAVHLDKIDDNRFRLRENVAAPEELPGRYLYLDNMHAPHFGHFLTDVLSKVWAWEAARAAGAEDLGVLVERYQAPHVVALLAACGIPRDAIRPVTRPVRCAEVLFARQSFMIQGWTSPVAAATWRRIRDALDDGHGPEKVFVSRARVPNRKMVNEAEVEAVFRRRGFFVAHPQELTMRQQVTMWANARFVAGTAGSNMFGLGFQRRLQRALLINSPNFLQFQEMFVQAGCDSETGFYFGQALDSEVHGVWRVTPEDLARHLDGWLGTAPPGAARVPAARSKADYLNLFDEIFYIMEYADVRAAVAAGTIPSGRRHYELAGFDEGRRGFLFDEVWYAARYPEVLGEIASGNFASCADHYVAIGHLVDFLPHALAVPWAAPADAAAEDIWMAAAARQIDLGEAKPIAEVRVGLRQADVGGRHAEFAVSIAFDPADWIELCRSGSASGDASGPFVWKAELPAFARFVRVMSVSGELLDLEKIVVFGPGARAPYQIAVPDAAAGLLPDRDLFGHFISLGDHCEFGVVQRNVGLEPLDLLGFAGTGDDATGLILAMEERFAAFGTPEDLRLSIDGDEWIAWSQRYGVSFHTQRKSHLFTEAQMRFEMGKRLRFLADKLVEDLEAGTKIFVRRANKPVRAEEMLALRRAMDQYGAPVLLWVCVDPAAHACVLEEAPGLLRGSIRRMVTYEQATDVRVEDWRELCQAVVDWRAAPAAVVETIVNVPAPVIAVAASGEAVNLAWRRPATQISLSEWSRGATLAEDAAGAVDGNPNGTRKFHTGMEDAPWWQVDLGAATTISAVRIYNAADRAVRRRFERFTISIAFDEGDEWIEVYRKDDEKEIGGINGNPFFWKPELSVFGRLLRVTAAERGFLHLDQIEVFGPGEIPPPVVGPDGALFSRFISLGDNCEFGIVQHETGVVSHDLLRYAGATDNDALIEAMQERFANFGTPEDLEMTETAVHEWHSGSRGGKAKFHTFRFSHEIDRETMAARESWRLQYLGGKLVHDIETAEKIFVRRSDQPVATETILALFRAMREIGAATLLWVSLADAAHPHATVEVLAPGLLRGYIRWLTPPHYAQDVCVDDWRDVCRAALAVYEAGTG